MAMRKGTRVGQAYVDLTVNGDDVNKDIVDDVEKAGPGVEKAGKEHGEGYGDEFSEGFFQRIKGKMDSFFDKKVNEFGKSGGKAGEDAGENFLSRFTDKMKRDDGSTFKNALASLADGSGEHLGESISTGLLKALDKLTPEAAARVRKLMVDVERASVKAEQALDKVFSDDGSDPVRLNSLTHAARTAETAAQRLERQLRTLYKAEGLLGDAVSGNRGGKKNEESLGDKIGRLFGASSRNNFLNIFGKSLGGIVSLADKGRQAATKMFGVFSEGFKGAEEGSSFFQKSLSGFSNLGSKGAGGISEAFSGLAKSGPAAAGAVVVVVVALSAMVSVVGALIGLVVALAAAITSALVGALAVAGAGIFALVAAGGLLTAAFMSMTDAQKKALAADFRPLRAEMVGIGQIIFKEMVPALHQMSENLQRALYLFAPLATVIGKSFGEAGKILTASFSGPGFQAFATALGTYLPGIITNLSTALGGFLNGLLGLFAVIMPYVLQFSQYLAGVAQNFSNFANSAEGRNKIKDFVDRAVVSLLALWNAAQQVFGFIADLLFDPNAQAAGNTIFDGIAAKFREFRDAIAQASADGSLKKFFDDAIEFGSQLWGVIESLYNAFIALYNSGVLQAVGDGLATLADFINVLAIVATPIVDLMGVVMPFSFAALRHSLDLTLGSVKGVSTAFSKIGGFIGRVAQQLGITSSQRQASSAWSGLNGTLAQTTSLFGMVAQAARQANLTVAGGNDLAKPVPIGSNVPSMPKLISLGNAALAGTNIPKPKAPKQYHNPYEDYANSLIKSGPSVRTQIAQALASLNKQVTAAINDALDAETASEARKGLSELGKALVAQGKSLVDGAQQAINSAASQLASANSAADAARALAAVRRAQKDMAAAIAASKRLRAAQKIVAAQNIVSDVRVDKLLAGLKSRNATLADYAVAREKVAALLKDANDKLTAAVALRTDFAKAVTESIKQFGELTNAQGQTLDGVAQSVTANDITTTLQDRLDKIKAFQNNLLLLRAQGLSDSAYKQIVDAGVDGGAAYAQALIDGGIGSIQDVNSLVSQIDNLAGTLGDQTAASLYDAGVNAAQGLVDGLTSLQSQINAAGEALGETIAKAIAKKLGIKSPSTVLFAMMDDVGDGAVGGLDNQHSKLVQASKRFSDQIAVSPEAAAYAASQGQSPVSGNDSDPRYRDLIIHTPTEDPVAVAREVLNETVGRL